MASLLVGALYLLSTPLVGSVVLYSLESRYPAFRETPQAADTIVVLGGYYYVDDFLGNKTRLASDSLARCLYALQLYKRCGGCRLILSGGNLYRERASASSLAFAMRSFLLEGGVRSEDLVLEDESLSTYENARLVSEWLADNEPNRVLLVTDALSMLRAKRCFEAQGIHAIPAPCDFRSTDFEFSLLVLLPTADGIDQVNDSAHEWLGLLWYWLRGWV